MIQNDGNALSQKWLFPMMARQIENVGMEWGWSYELWTWGILQEPYGFKGFPQFSSGVEIIARRPGVGVPGFSEWGKGKQSDRCRQRWLELDRYVAHHVSPSQVSIAGRNCKQSHVFPFPFWFPRFWIWLSAYYSREHVHFKKTRWTECVLLFICHFVRL